MAGESQSGTGAGITQWISIAGNIKQQYLPFVLRPGSNLNSNINGDRELTDGPQFFSFKNKNPDKFKAGFGRLNICPSSVFSPEFEMFFNKDISNRLLYDYTSLAPVTIDSVFNQLPSIQIREYQVDSKLDQFLNVFYDVFSSLGDILGQGIDSLKKDGVQAAMKKVLGQLKNVIGELKDFLIGQGKYENGPSFMLDSNGNSRWDEAIADAKTGAQLGGPAGAAVGFAVGAAGSIPPPIDTFIEKFPFIMYYKLQSYSTLNVYELPCALDGMWSTKGGAGWGVDGFALTNLMKGKDSMLSKVFSMVTGLGENLVDRVRINYMPRWDAGKGAGEGAYTDQVQVKFTLFNDTEQAALMNFIFVNTIVPNNMWLQYGMLTHSPCLYDVKIAGVKRLFCCAGEFDVKPVGLMRAPSQDWIMQLCNKYVNGDAGKTYAKRDAKAMIAAIQAGNLIKIPDAYDVTLNFASRLPQNFNNFLYNYSRNGNMYEEYRNQPSHQASVIGGVLDKIKEDVKSTVEQQIKQIDGAPVPADVLAADAKK